jgi:hypothetical protein
MKEGEKKRGYVQIPQIELPEPQKAENCFSSIGPVKGSGEDSHY